MSKKSQKATKKRLYSNVAKLYFEEDLSCYEILKIVGVEKSCVNSWINIFAIENNLLTRPMKEIENKIQSEEPSLEVQIQDLKTQLKQKDQVIGQLSNELQDFKKQAKELSDWNELYDKAYTMLIDTAEKQYGISIRKKTRAK